MTVIVLGAVCHILQQHRTSGAGQRGAETRERAVKILNIKIVNQIEIQLYDFERVIRLVDYPPSLNCSRVASEHHSCGGHVVHRGVHVDHK